MFAPAPLRLTTYLQHATTVTCTNYYYMEAIMDEALDPLEAVIREACEAMGVPADQIAEIVEQAQKDQERAKYIPFDDETARSYLVDWVIPMLYPTPVSFTN